MNGLNEVAFVAMPLPTVFVASVAIVAVIGAVLDHRNSALSSRGRQTAGGRYPFSLARVQFVTIGTTVLATWFALGVTKHTWETVTEPIGVLVGISFLTCVVASMIEPRRPVAIPAGRLAAILHDASGLALHRVMLAVWTSMLCIIVAVTVCGQARFAELEWQLVAINAGTSVYYLVFKSLEAV
jgi:hypothetical protein